VRLQTNDDVPGAGEDQEGFYDSPSPGLENHDPQTPKVGNSVQKKNSAAPDPNELASLDKEQPGITVRKPQVVGMDNPDDGFHDALEIMAASSGTGDPPILDDIA
jgi:hypothetical protein